MFAQVVKIFFFFCIFFTDDSNDKKSSKALKTLEDIDDDLDDMGIEFVKVDNYEEFKKNGNEPQLVLYDKGIPNIYEGNLNNRDMVLKWINEESASDEIEDITDEMLDDIIEKMDHVAVLFCKYFFLTKLRNNIN